MLLNPLRRFAPQHVELVSKNQNFRLKPCSRPEQPGQRAYQQSEKIHHRERASPDSRLLASGMRFPIGTAGAMAEIHHAEIIDSSAISARRICFSRKDSLATFSAPSRY
jgi:hypothetical protein